MLQRLQRLLSAFKRRKEEEKVEEEVVGVVQETKHVVRKTPKFIVVGGERGGRGKSFIATSMAVGLATLNKLLGRKEYVILIDTDVDNASATSRVYNISAVSAFPDKYATFSDFVLSMASPSRLLLLEAQVVTCSQAQIRIPIVLIPPYQEREKYQFLKAWSNVRHDTVQFGMVHLCRFVKERLLPEQEEKRYPGAFVIMDLKPKGYEDVRADPMHIAVHHADLYIHVETEDSLFEKTPEVFVTKYHDYFDKMILVVNMVTKNEEKKQQLMNFLVSLFENGLKAAFLIFESNWFMRLYKDQYDVPTRYLNDPRAQRLLALLAFANLVTPEDLERCKCKHAVDVYEKMCAYNWYLGGRMACRG